MKNIKIILASAFLVTTTLYNAKAQMNGKADSKTVIVGGEAMYPLKDIVTNALQSKDHTTLVAAVKAAGLVEALQGAGPFTVLAPVNNAFEDLPEGTVTTLLKPENKKALTGVLTYHVISGKFTYDDIVKTINKSGGKATLKTLNGQEIYFAMNGMHNINVWDTMGNYASISTYDVIQSNGVIHVIDKVLMPKM